MINNWHIQNNHIVARVTGGMIPHSLEEVFGQDDQNATPPVFLDTDGYEIPLRYSSIGSPLKVRLILDNSGELIRLYPFVSRRRKEISVDISDGRIINHCVFGNECFRVTGNIDVINELISSVNLENDGSLHFRDYLTLKKKFEEACLREIENNVNLSSKELLQIIGNTQPNGCLNATLYPYQEEGFRWMAFMLKQGCGCILGDEMGLGKTLQVIAVITDLVSRKKTPVLVVCPVSLLENWRRECARFSPALDVYMHHGSKRSGRYSELLDHDVILVSYNTVVSDLSMLKMINWELVVLDEAQNIKNYGSTRAVSIKKVPRELGIAITGTPFENHITDIWSIADFVLPGYMGDIGTFKRNFRDNVDAADELEPMLSPVMLRRLVRDVAQDLPDKVVIEQPIIMPEAEAVAYEQYRQEACGNIDSEKIGLGVLQKMRMFCTHPKLCSNTISNNVEQDSLKYQRLCEITEEVFAAREKVIVFTSYKKMFDIFAEDIPSRFNVPIWSINGETPVEERQKIVDDFNHFDGPAFLALNPRAAGTGLNITGANHVIHYNPEWNPALEDQASARAYRRGQTKTVFIHRLFYRDTVEEVVNERIVLKRTLAEHAVIGNTGETDSRQEIMRALQISPMYNSKEDTTND